MRFRKYCRSNPLVFPRWTAEKRPLVDAAVPTISAGNRDVTLLSRWCVRAQVGLHLRAPASAEFEAGPGSRRDTRHSWRVVFLHHYLNRQWARSQPLDHFCVLQDPTAPSGLPPTRPDGQQRLCRPACRSSEHAGLTRRGRRAQRARGRRSQHLCGSVQPRPPEKSRGREGCDAGLGRLIPHAASAGADRLRPTGEYEARQNKQAKMAKLAPLALR